MWLPSLVQAQLVQGWQLESLEFDYPGSTRLHINTLVLNGNPSAIGVRVTAHDLDLDIFQRSLEATNVDVAVVYKQAKGKTDAFTLDDLAIPTIVRPGKLPRASIKSLRVSLQSGENPATSWLFEEVQLERQNPDESRLNASLPLPIPDGLYARIDIRMLRDSLQAQLQLDLPDQSKILQVDFRQSAETENISSEISGHGDLQALQPLITAVLPDVGLPLDKLQAIRGNVTFAGHFTGSNEQILDRIRMTAQNVVIDWGNENLNLDLDLEAQRQQDGIQINFLSPGIVRFTARNNFLAGQLSELMPISQLSLNTSGNAVDNLELTFEPLSTFKLQADAPWSGAFSGAATLEITSDLLDLSLDLAPDAEFQWKGPLTPPGLTGLGTINIKLGTSQAVTFKSPLSASLPMGAHLQASGRLVLDGNTVQFRESSRFQLMVPRLIADLESRNLDLHESEFSGTAECSIPVGSDESAGGLRYSGSGDVQFAGDITAAVRFSGEADTGQWTINVLPTRFTLTQALKALEMTTGTNPGQLEADGGTIDIEGSVSSADTLSGKVNISGEKMNFSLAESAVDGIDFELSGKLDETVSATGWFSIDRIALAAGLNLLQTRASVGLITQDTIELDNFQADFFGGRLSTDYLQLSPQGLDDTQIRMTDIDLGQVLDYIDIGSLKGTGTLEILLPAGSRGSDLYIRDGTFRANGPGVLNYSGSMPDTSVENIGLSALENFHYSELDGTINYQPDGSYQLMVHLAGSNPELYEGYPIALNLNISGKLPKAFEVLFLTGNFDKAVMERIMQE